MKLIVGLGNPGRSYAMHRHNVGFRVIDLLAERTGISLAKRSFGAFVGKGVVAGEAALLAKPQTYMNLSGDAVGPLLGYYRLGREELIVAHDDLDLALGAIKISRGAGDGGHNGVHSIIGAVGGKDFTRVRMGIGRPPERIDAADYVLQRFGAEEEAAAEELVVRSADAVELLIREGLVRTQQEYH